MDLELLSFLHSNEKSVLNFIFDKKATMNSEKKEKNKESVNILLVKVDDLFLSFLSSDEKCSVLFMIVKGLQSFDFISLRVVFGP